MIPTNTDYPIPQGENKPVNTVSFKEDSDLEYARGTYIDLIEKNRESIEIMIELARASEHPRVFEALSNSIKTTSDIADRLISLHLSNKQLMTANSQKKSAEDSAGSSTAATTTTTNNNVFIGSTEELQKLLQGKQFSEKLIEQPS